MLRWKCDANMDSSSTQVSTQQLPELKRVGTAEPESWVDQGGGVFRPSWLPPCRSARSAADLRAGRTRRCRTPKGSSARTLSAARARRLSKSCPASAPAWPSAGSTSAAGAPILLRTDICRACLTRALVRQGPSCKSMIETCFVQGSASALNLLPDMVTKLSICRVIPPVTQCRQIGDPTGDLRDLPALFSASRHRFSGHMRTSR